MSLARSDPAIPALVSTGRPQYDRAISAFSEWNSGRPVTLARIAGYLEEQKKSKRFEAATLRLHKVALRKSFMASVPVEARGNVRFVSDTETIFRAMKMPTPKKTLRASKYISEEETDVFGDYLSEHSAKLELLFLFLYHSAARISEARGIRLTDCRRMRKSVEIRISGKGSKMRTVTIPVGLFDRIMRETKPRVYLFEGRRPGHPMSRTNAWTLIHRHSIRALGRPISPHVLRHARATHLLNAGVGVQKVSVFLGHGDITTTTRFYLHGELSPDEAMKTAEDVLKYASRKKKDDHRATG